MEEYRDTEYSDYEISNLGNVRNKTTGFVLSPFPNTNGYLVVGIAKKHIRVHRLIAQAFIPNPENKSDIDHINRIKDDNRIENLRWATKQENMQNVAIQKNNQLGHQYICPHTNGYIFQLVRNGVKYSKFYKTLDDAVKGRDLYLETGEVYIVPRTNSTGHKCIFKNRQNFMVRMVVKGIEYCKTFKTIKDAIEYRDSLLIE